MRPLVGIQHLSLWTDSDYERLRRFPIFQEIKEESSPVIYSMLALETAALKYRLLNLLIER
jgi:hypothetical protein